MTHPEITGAFVRTPAPMCALRRDDPFIHQISDEQHCSGRRCKRHRQDLDPNTPSLDVHDKDAARGEYRRAGEDCEQQANVVAVPIDMPKPSSVLNDPNPDRDEAPRHDTRDVAITLGRRPFNSRDQKTACQAAIPAAPNAIAIPHHMK